MKLLLLAGTSEARSMAAALAGNAGIDVVASLSGATREPLEMPVPTRSGGFGGRAAFAKYLQDQMIEAVLDATHPFAAKITRRSAEVCHEAGLPYLRLQRPGWEPVEGDNWHFVDSEANVAALTNQGDTVFLATGRQTLARFDNLAGRHLICRQIENGPPKFPFDNGEYLIGRPPFSVDDEVVLFQQRRVDWLVVKNAGGRLSSTKLDAARILEIPVILIKRPPVPDGIETVQTPEAALAWVRGLA